MGDRDDIFLSMPADKDSDWRCGLKPGFLLIVH
jgi:hypothetical protein